MELQQFIIELPEDWKEPVLDEGTVTRQCPSGVGRTIIKQQLLGYEIDIDIGYLQAYFNEYEGNAPIGNIVENIWTFTDDDLKEWLSILGTGLRCMSREEKRSRRELLKEKKSLLDDIEELGYGGSEEEKEALLKQTLREYRDVQEMEGKGYIIDDSIKKIFQGENEGSSSPQQKKYFWLYIIFNMCTFRDSEFIGLINRLDAADEILCAAGGGAAGGGAAAAGSNAAGDDAMDEGD